MVEKRGPEEKRFALFSMTSHIFLLYYAATRTKLVPASPPPLPQQQHCRYHRHSVRDEQRGLAADCLFPPFLPSTHLSSHLLFPCLLLLPFCFKHGRVNLLILQAASLSIYLSSCVFFTLSLPASLRQGCAVRPFQSSGVVRSDGWLSTFCCLPLRSWEIYRLADYQAWKPISLSHSSLPSSIHACLAPSTSLSLFQHLLRYQKTAFIMERCVQNNIEIRVWTEGSLLRVIVDMSEGNSVLRVIRLVFDSLSCPSSSSSSPLLPAPSQACNTQASIYVSHAGGNYSIAERCWANCCLKIVIALLLRPFFGNDRSKALC